MRVADASKLLAVGETPTNAGERRRGHPEMTLYVAVSVSIEIDLRRRDRCEAKSGSAADWRLLEEQSSSARRHEIEKTLMNLDREVRAIEVALDSRSRRIEYLCEFMSVGVVDVMARITSRIAT